MDLAALGEELRTRRKALGISRAELARRVGVSAPYVWLIENARPRKSGEPSRPGQVVLHRWAATLGLDPEETMRLLDLAGFERSPVASAPPAFMAARAALPDRDATFAPLMQPRPPSPPESLRFEAARAPTPSHAVPSDVEALLREAERAGRLDETIDLLQSFIAYLHFRLEER